jgi:hypothetical protein
LESLSFQIKNLSRWMRTSENAYLLTVQPKNKPRIKRSKIYKKGRKVNFTLFNNSIYPFDPPQKNHVTQYSPY